MPAPPDTTAPLPPRPESLPSVEELVRVLDVAGEVRRRQERLEKLWDRDAARSELRETLAETARLSGEPLDEAGADAAVDWYYDRLHRFRDPPAGLRTRLWRMYAGRGPWLAGAGGLLLAAAAAWWWLRPEPPPDLSDVRDRLDRAIAEVRPLAGGDPRFAADAWAADAQRYAEAGNEAALERLADQAEGVARQLKAAYDVRVLRLWDIADEPAGSPALEHPQLGGPGGPTLILGAFGTDGRPVEIDVADSTTGRTIASPRWGQAVPADAFDRLADSADESGRPLKPTLFAVKRAGEFDWDVRLTDSEGQPLPVGRQFAAVHDPEPRP